MLVERVISVQVLIIIFFLRVEQYLIFFVIGRKLSELSRLFIVWGVNVLACVFMLFELRLKLHGVVVCYCGEFSVCSSYFWCRSRPTPSWALRYFGSATVDKQIVIVSCISFVLLVCFKKYTDIYSVSTHF